MTQIAKQSGTLSPAMGGAQAHAPEAPLAHPKIARRPSQWKQHAAAPIIDPEADHKPTLHTATPARPFLTHWQDDVPFNILLMVTVVALNALLISFTATPDTKPPEPSLMIQQVTRAPVLPTPHGEDSPAVNMFANPNERIDLGSIFE